MFCSNSVVQNEVFNIKLKASLACSDQPFPTPKKQSLNAVYIKQFVPEALVWKQRYELSYGMAATLYCNHFNESTH